MKTGGRKVERKLPLMARSHVHLNNKYIRTTPTTINKCVHLCIACVGQPMLQLYVHSMQ